MDRIFQLLKESAIYGLSGIITRSITIFLVPIYTRVFTPADYGTMAIIGSIVAVAGSFLGLGAEAGIAAYFYDSEDEKYRADLLCNYLFLQVSTGAALGVLLWWFSPLLAKTFLDSDSGQTYIVLAGASVVFGAVGSVLFNVFRLLRRPWTLMVFSLTSAVSSIAASIILVVILRYGLWGNYVAGLLVTAVFSVIALWLLRGRLREGRVSMTVIRSLVRIGLPYIPTGLALLVIAFSGRFVLELFHTLTEVGLFSIATSFAAGIGLVTGAFQMAVGPYALSIQQQPDARATYANLLTLLLIGGMGLAVAVSVFAREILLVLTTPTYLGAAVAVPFLAISTIVVSVSYVASLGCWIGKRTGGLAWATSAGAIVNVAAGFLLVPVFGIVGASVAVLLGQCFYVGLLFWAAQRVYPIPYRWREIGVVAGLGGGVILLGFHITTDSLLIAMVLKGAVVCLFPAGLLLFGVVSPGHLRRALHRVGQVRRPWRGAREAPSVT